MPPAPIILPTPLRNELIVFLAVYPNPRINSKRAIAATGLKRSTYFSTLARLRAKGVIANISDKGREANYQFNAEGINRFKPELSIHSRPCKTYFRLGHSLIAAISQEHEKDIQKGFIKINPERLAKEVKKRTERTKRQLVTKTRELEANKIPQDADFQDVLKKYNQLNPGETELSYWKRKLNELQKYERLNDFIFSERDIKRNIKTYEKRVRSSIKATQTTGYAKKKNDSNTR